MGPKPDNTAYIHILSDLKVKIKQARQRAALAVNTELLVLYWEIGNTILVQQKKAGWGAKVIDRLSADLRTEFPEMTGLSVRNLKYMRAFAVAYPQFVQAILAQTRSSEVKQELIVQAPLAQLSWYH